MITPEAKLNFVRRLSSQIIDGIVNDIIAGKVPAEWEGAELRRLLADRFADASPKAYMTIGRKRRYNNDKLVKGF